LLCHEKAFFGRAIYRGKTENHPKKKTHPSGVARTISYMGTGNTPINGQENQKGVELGPVKIVGPVVGNNGGKGGGGGGCGGHGWGGGGGWNKPLDTKKKRK